MPNPLTMKLEQFTAFDAGERRQLDRLLDFPTRRFSRGRAILAEGIRVDQIHLVTKGLACRSKTLADGNRQLMALMFPGDLCDLEVFVLREMDHDILALADTTCVLIPASTIRALLTETSNLTRALWWSTMTDSAVLREWIVNHGSRDAEKRVAHLLYEALIRLRIVGMAERNTFQLSITQEEFSDATGMSPVHMNRVLQRLRERELIEWKGRTVTVLDPEGLKAFSGFHANYLHLDRTEAGDPAVSARVGDLI